ncbi:MAG: WD40 repeat domain-containing serine/threonine protein kinase [Limisphaerales bacterium]
MHPPSTPFHPREREVFLDALEYASPESRAAFLKQACAGDPTLLAAVEGLLAAHGETGFMPASPVMTRTLDAAGRIIGPYRLLGTLGEGGFGHVYLAEQQHPLPRRVALKILHPGLDSASVLARFDVERQVLARLEHPGIARIFDAGTTGEGRPFFAMEFIAGVPITAFCRQERLPLTQRLQLFVRVCRAVQYAHQKGILHRDLKPSNILVTDLEDIPTPKVIDFGIAKALTQPVAPATPATQVLGLLGTPAYMSPEQADLGGLEVDTRSDLYSLGVVLHELLTGRPLLDGGSLARSGLAELRSRIRDTEPAPPSHTVASLPAAAAAELAGQLRTTPPIHRAQLSGDLDWIVLRCLEKERDDRYASVADLAADLERHLAHEPVTAGPRTAGYFARKFARRHRLAFALSAGILAAFLFGLGLAVWQYGAKSAALERARAAEREQARLREVAEAQANLARRRAYIADVNLAQAALITRNFAVVRPLLAACVPAPGEPDFRGWEWWFLRASCPDHRLRELCRRPAAVTELSISSDGQSLALGEEGGRVSVWSMQTGGERERWATGLPSPPVLFGPTRDVLAFADRADPSASEAPWRVRLWNTATQNLTVDLFLDAPCCGLGFTSDGTRLWTATTAGSIDQWSIPAGTRLASHRLPTPSLDTPRVVFTPEPEWGMAALVDSGGKLGVFDLGTGELLWNRSVAGFKGAFCLAVGPGNGLVAVGSLDRPGFRLQDLHDGRVIPTVGVRVRQANVLLFPSARNQLVWAGIHQAISIVDLPASLVESLANRRDRPAPGAAGPGSLFPPRLFFADGPVRMSSLLGQDSEILCLALHSDGRTLVSGARDGSVALWDLDNAEPEFGPTAVCTDVRAWSFTGGDETVVTCDSAGRVVSRSLVQPSAPRELLVLTDALRPLFFDAAGRFLVTTNEAPAVRIADLDRGLVLPALETDADPAQPLLFTATTRRLVTWHPASHSLQEWSSAEGKRVSRLAPPEFATFTEAPSIAVSRDERWLVWAGSDGQGGILDRTQSVSEPLDLGLPSVRGLVLSPDASTLIAFGDQGPARAWSLARRQPLGPLRGSLRGLLDMAFSPDGQRLLVCADRDSLRIWETESFRELVFLDSEGAGAVMARFSPTGDTLAALSANARLALWHLPRIAPRDSKPPVPVSSTRGGKP